jgi:uncharacterized membrane protein YfcA
MGGHSAQVAEAWAVTSPDPWFIALGILAAVLVGLSKGGLPVVGMLAVPILSLRMSPLQAAGLLLPIYVASDLFGLWAYRRDFSARNLKILIPSAVFGIAVGWATASWVSHAWVTLLIGAIGLVFSLNNVRQRWRKSLPKREADVPRGLWWGSLTGFTSFISHAGGPPFQVYVLPQQLDKMVFAGTSTILFAVVNAVKLVPYWALGQLSLSHLRITLLLIPPAVLATLAGVRLVRCLPEAVFFRFVNLALLLVSVKLLWDGVQAMT